MSAPLGIAEAGHADRPVRLVREGGREIVVKRYVSADVAQIVENWRALWESPFGARRTPPGLPEPVSWDASSREVHMEALDGGTLTRHVLDRADAVEASPPESAAARLLADLHASGVRMAGRREPGTLLRRFRVRLERMPDPGVRLAGGAVLDAMDACLDDLPDEPLEAGHGDWSPHNVLLTDAGPRLIDLDRAGMARAGRDVAHWGAWAWTRTLLTGGTPSWAAGDRFEAAYAVARPEAAARLARSRGFDRATGLMRCALGWSALRADPSLALIVLAEAGRRATASA